MFVNEYAVTVLSVADDNAIEPYYFEGEVGEEAKFTCKSWDEPLWFFNTTVSEPLDNDRMNIIRFKNLQSSHSGLYYCYGSYDDDSTFFIAKAELLVISKYIFELTLGLNCRVSNHKVTIQC